MKKTFLPCFLAAALIALASGCSSMKTLPLAANGATPYAIVVAPEKETIASEKFAAGELRDYLKKITGADFPVVEEGQQTGPGIYVGATARAKKALINAEKLGQEEWVLRTDGKDLLISGGRPRGTLYGVYEFLEKYGGCRWVSHDLETVPKQSEFRAAVQDERGEPAFIWRTTSLYNRHDGGPDSPTKEEYALFLVRNRYNGHPYWLDEPRFGYALRAFGRPEMCHTFWQYQKDWKDVKPEFFAMLADGKRAPRPANALGADFCLTNPEARDRIFAQLLAYIEQDRAEAAAAGRPAPDVYALSQNDTSGNYCHCPKCMAVSEREGSYVGLMIDFVNDLADRARARYPEIKLLTESYQFTKEPPKHIRPRENVIIRLALLDREYRGTECADVVRPITAPSNAEARRITDAWAAIVPGNLCIFDYFMPYRSAFRYPYDATTKITVNLEYWHKLGIRRVYPLDTCAKDAAFRNMCDWLFFRKSVHPENDTGRLIEEYMAGYFGPAAGPMRTYYDLLVKGTLASEKPFAITPPPLQPYLTADFFRQADALLDRAEALCAGEANARYLRNVQFERIPVDSAQLHMWHRFADLPGFAGRKEDVLKRYEKNKRRLIKSYSTQVHAWINDGGPMFDSELTALRVEPPAEFKGRSANIRYMANKILGISRGETVPDPDAAGGMARRLGGGKEDEHKLPFLAKIHDQAENRDFPLLRLEKVPADEKYHWHHLGAAPLTGDCGLWSSLYIWVPMGWAAIPPPNNELDVYISLKFTGPAYVPGSTQTNAVLMDRILVAQPKVSGEDASLKKK